MFTKQNVVCNYESCVGNLHSHYVLQLLNLKDIIQFYRSRMYKTRFPFQYKTYDWTKEGDNQLWTKIVVQPGPGPGDVSAPGPRRGKTGPAPVSRAPSVWPHAVSLPAPAPPPAPDACRLSPPPTPPLTLRSRTPPVSTSAP